MQKILQKFTVIFLLHFMYNFMSIVWSFTVFVLQFLIFKKNIQSKTVKSQKKFFLQEIILFLRFISAAPVAVIPSLFFKTQ